MDAVSGAFFPESYQVDGPYGPVDGRDGATVDTDVDEHEMTPRVTTVPART